MNFFFDANISFRLSDMIAAFTAGSHVIVHISQDDRFSHNNNRFGNSTPDTEYITVLKNDVTPWVVLSGDCNIVDSALERAALLNSGLTFFALDDHWSKSSIEDQAWKLVKIWGEIVRHADSPEPALYRIKMGRSLGVELIRSGARVRGGRFRG